MGSDFVMQKLRLSSMPYSRKASNTAGYSLWECQIALTIGILGVG